MGKETEIKNKKKREIFIPNATLLPALIWFLAGIFPGYSYWNLVKNCTSEIKGTIVAEDTISSKYPDRSNPADKYLSGRYISKIEVETDGIFRYDKLQAASAVGNKGDEVIIRYDPDDPDEYYFKGYRSNVQSYAVMIMGLCGFNIILSLFWFIYYNIPRNHPGNKVNS